MMQIGFKADDEKIGSLRSNNEADKMDEFILPLPFFYSGPQWIE
jgi:hypothetical protein